jgi:hypothetical protein
MPRFFDCVGGLHTRPRLSSSVHESFF